MRFLKWYLICWNVKNGVDIKQRNNCQNLLTAIKQENCRSTKEHKIEPKSQKYFNLHATKFVGRDEHLGEFRFNRKDNHLLSKIGQLKINQKINY